MQNPDKFNWARITSGPLASTDEAGCNGAFSICHKDDPDAPLLVILAQAAGWEKCTVTKQRKRMLSSPKPETPSEEDMRTVKSLFFKPEETLVEYHPHSKSSLFPIPHHRVMWRCIYRDFPLPETERKVEKMEAPRRIITPNDN